jgi:uncharacterized membrane protein YphA (DoxX/SURF4 family)
MYLEAYYASYVGLCAAIILWLGWTFHRAGAVLLNDSFPGNPTLVSAVSHLLDVGFYLLSVGYVALWHQVRWEMMRSYEDVASAVLHRVGGLMLLLGFAHLFNLLLLAIFKRRSETAQAA